MRSGGGLSPAIESRGDAYIGIDTVARLICGLGRLASFGH